MASFLVPVATKKHKLKEEQEKENPPTKRLKFETAPFRENRNALIDKKNVYTETAKAYFNTQASSIISKNTELGTVRKSKLDSPRSRFLNRKKQDEITYRKNVSYKPSATTSREERAALLLNTETARNNLVLQDLSINKNTGTAKKLTQDSCSLSLRPRSPISYRKSGRSTVRHQWGSISPIADNKYAPLTVVIHQGIPDGRQKFVKKNTLGSRGNIRLNRQGMLEDYFDDFYDIDLLEDIIYIQLGIQHEYILRPHFLHMFSACLSSRSAVINWLIQVQEYLSLPYQEIFTVVYLFDSVIASTKMAINMYQLVGIIILWIVSKNDDIVNSPMAPKMLALCKGVYTKQQLLKMERKLLVFFDFRLNIADVTIFVIFYMKKLNIESDRLNMFLNCVNYVLECFTLNEMFSTKLPSIKAAAAVTLVANILQQRSLKVRDLLKNYNLEEIRALEHEMLMQVQIIQDPRFAYRQPYIKYSSLKYSQASIVILQSLVAS